MEQAQEQLDVKRDQTSGPETQKHEQKQQQEAKQTQAGEQEQQLTQNQDQDLEKEQTQEYMQAPLSPARSTDSDDHDGASGLAPNRPPEEDAKLAGLGQGQAGQIPVQ